MPCSALPLLPLGMTRGLPSTLAPHGQAGPLPSTSWCLPRPLRARRACPQPPAHSLSSLPQKPGPTVLFGGGCLLSRFPHVSSSPGGGGAPRQGSPHTHEPSWNRACPGAGWRGAGDPGCQEGLLCICSREQPTRRPLLHSSLSPALGVSRWRDPSVPCWQDHPPPQLAALRFPFPQQGLIRAGLGQ